MNLRPLVAPIILLLSGCAALGDGRSYPSLAKRPIEAAAVPGAATASPASPGGAVVDAELASTLTDLGGKARAGAAEFDASYPKVEAQVRAARGSSPATENWSVATLGLGQLEAARSSTVIALASLDVLYTERMEAVASGKLAGGAEAVDKVRREVLVMVDSQNDRMDALKAELREP